MYTELRQFLPLDTPLGRGYAIGVIDYGQEHSLIWVTVMDKDGQVWAVPNKDVRMERNWTMGALRGKDDAEES